MGLGLGACTAQQRAAMAMMGAPRDEAGGPSAALMVRAQDGTLVDAGYAHGNVVLVDFWASWCGPCQHSIPFYRRMHQRFAHRGLRVVGVNVDDDREDLQEYTAIHPMPFDVVWDEDKGISHRFSVLQLPTSFLFDRRGRLRKSRTGFDPTEARQIEDEIRLLLGEPAPNDG